MVEEHFAFCQALFLYASFGRFYDVRYKGLCIESWTTMFGNKNQYERVGQANPYIAFGYAVEDYSAQHTTIIYTFTWQVLTNGQMDFQVETLEGLTNQTFHDGHIKFGIVGYTFYGKESGWSNTQTITLGEVATIMPIPKPPDPLLAILQQYPQPTTTNHKQMILEPSLYR